MLRSAVRSPLGSTTLSCKEVFYVCQNIKEKPIVSRSSSGLGHCPFTAVTGVRVPYGMPFSTFLKLNGAVKLIESLRVRCVLDFLEAQVTMCSAFGALAQLGERNTGSVEVSGSIPLGSTKFRLYA